VHLSAPRLYFPFSGLRAFRSNRYLFYNEVFIHTQFKSDIYQVSINVDKNTSARVLLLQVINITWPHYRFRYLLASNASHTT